MEHSESTQMPWHDDFMLASAAAPLNSVEKTIGIGQFGTLYGSSPAMRALYEILQKIAPTEVTVFIMGESGTGKELVASTIHQNSARAAQPFIAVNCSAIPANLIEAELFGCEKGNFSGAARQHEGCFERAGGGTLFLDEITEMPLALQATLLRALESRRFRRVGGGEEIELHARIIAATSCSPVVAVSTKKIRADLLYRLSVFPISVPALRDRGDDVLELAELFLKQLNRTGLNKVLPDNAEELLKSQTWPGNVRELKNLMQRAYILADHTLEFIGLLNPASVHTQQRTGKVVSIGIGTRLDEAEREIIYATLDHCGWNKRVAATVLGISLKTLYNRLAEYQKSERSASPALARSS